jgi:tetratricopeptide (TPR) repeat protein
VTSSRLTIPAIALAASIVAAAIFGALALGGPPVGGSVVIRTTVPGASVFVDGEFRGVSPVTISHLAPEAHALRVEKGGFEPLVTSLVVREEHSERDFELSPAPRGALEVTSVPAGAEVSLDGRFRGVTPLRLEDLCTGAHGLTVEKANRHPWSGTVFVQEGRTAEVSCELADRVLEYLQNALADEPDGILRYMELAHYYFIQGDTGNSVDVYRRGLVLAQDKLAELQHRLIEAQKSGDGNENKRTQAEHTEIKKQKKKLDKQIHNDRKAGPNDFRAAMEEVNRQVRAQFPRSVAVALKEADAAERRGDLAGAAEVVERALRILPGSTALWERLALCRAKLGDYDELKAALVRAFRRSGLDAGIRVRLTKACLENAERFDAEVRRKLFGLLAGELARARQRGDREQRHRHALMEYRANREAGQIDKAVLALDKSLSDAKDAEAAAELKAEARRWLEDVAKNSPDPTARRRAETALDRL